MDGASKQGHDPECPETTLLLVANYDSGVGYAWWLMESFWAKLAEHCSSHNRVILAYPSISTVPPVIINAPLRVVEQDFSGTTLSMVLVQCLFLLRNRVRVIYFSDKGTWHWRYALYRFCGVSHIVVHVHTLCVCTSNFGLKSWLKRLVHRLPWLTINGAIGATDLVRRRLCETTCVPLERCFVAPNGLPLPDTAPAAADLHALFQMPAGRKVLVMTGRADRKKGVVFILQCLAQLPPEERDDLQFLFIGDGPDIAYFNAIATDMGIAGNCTFAGRREDVPALLEGADIAIHPSQGEVGYSLSILEYMRAGLPVMVPDNPSVCGATEHESSGMIYPEGNAAEATSMLRRLISDDALRIRLGEQARLAVQKYSLEATHTALLKAFDEITRKGSVVS